MPNTSSIAALNPSIWEKELFKDIQDQDYFENKNMTGMDTNNIVQVKRNLVKNQGDRAIFGLTAKLSGSGSNGDEELTGKEESLDSYSEAVLIDQKRFGVRLQGALNEQKTVYNMRMDAKEKLAIRLGEFKERQRFMKMGGVTSTDLRDANNLLYSQDATWSNSPSIVPADDENNGTGDRYICANSSGLGSLLSTDVMTLELALRAKVKAQLASPKVRPLRYNGEDIYVCFIHPWQSYDIRVNSSSSGVNWDQIQRDAQVRGDKNPIFTGSMGFYNGILFMVHEYVPVCQLGADFSPGATATNVQTFRALLCGRQAIIEAETSTSNFMAEESFDYDNKVGYAAGFIGGIKKPAFNSKDYGLVSIDTGATSL